MSPLKKQQRVKTSKHELRTHSHMQRQNVGHHYSQATTNNTIKQEQAAGDYDEQSIVFI
jgi:hypothetical protein